MKTLVKWLVGLVVLANVVWYTFQLYVPFRALVLTGLGRNPTCPLSEAIAGMRITAAHEARTRELMPRLRLLVKADGFSQWETPQGSFWLPGEDRELMAHLVSEQAESVYGTGNYGVRRGDIVLDCGAHVGVFTREALKRGAKRVVAIEPAAENIECLRRNFSSEIAEGRVVIYPKGVWDRDDSVVFHVVPGNSARDSAVLRFENAQDGPRIPLVPIDRLVLELNLDRVDFIKMDIEGAEQRAIVGANQTLARFHPRLALCAYHLEDDPARIPQLVRQAWQGYRMHCGPCEGVSNGIRPEVQYFQ